MGPNDLNAALDRANELLEAGKAQETLQCLAEIEAQIEDPDDQIEYASLKAWALAELERTDEAAAVVEAALEAYPDSGRLHATLGVVLSNQGDLEGAAEALQRAIELDEEDEVAVANLGFIHERLRDYENAVGLYERAINMGAEIDWVLKRKAAVHAELGDLAQARMTLKRYLSLAPDDAEQWITLGIMCSDESRFEDSFVAYRQAEQIVPDSIALRLNWGVTAVRAGKLDIAREQLVFLKNMAPDGPRALLLEAYVLEEERKLDDARALYQRALQLVGPEHVHDMYYALEAAMDFFARQSMREPCETLFRRAYAANACSVELCEAYREATGEYLDSGRWYSLLLEADYRDGLAEIYEREQPPGRNGFNRFQRAFQVVARDHDEAISLIVELAERMGERNVSVREFMNEHAVDDTFTGVYEIEREALVFSDDDEEAR